MARVRTLEQLSDAIDGDLAWRKRELTALASAIAGSKGVQTEALRRGAWTLLYAHWEGFVKQSCTYYLEYVSTQGLALQELSPPLLAVALRVKIVAASQAKQGSMHTALVEAITQGTSKASVPYDSATIKTNANLNYSTYSDVLLSVGCTPIDAEDLRDALDSILLRQRNGIAHGRQLTVSQDDWESLRGKIVNAMDHLRTEIQNAAATKGYRRSPSA